jgi:hypothetical protein
MMATPTSSSSGCLMFKRDDDDDDGRRSASDSQNVFLPVSHPVDFRPAGGRRPRYGVLVKRYQGATASDDKARLLQGHITSPSTIIPLSSQILPTYGRSSSIWTERAMRDAVSLIDSIMRRYRLLIIITIDMCHSSLTSSPSVVRHPA